MNRWTRLAAWLIPAVAFVHACGGSATTDSTSGNTNWLKYCDTEADCGEGLSCWCNSCQETCLESVDCDLAGSGSHCASSSEDIQCSSTPGGIAFCVQSCDQRSDCGRDDLACVNGSCVLRANGVNVNEDGGINAGNDAAVVVPPAPGDASVTFVEPCLQPIVEIVIPRSGSMTREFENLDYWTVVRNTLIDPDTGILPQVQSGVRLGLSLFGNPEPVVTGVCPEIISVPVDSNNYQAIYDTYSVLDAGDNSPMAEGISAVTAKLEAIQADAPKIILLTATGDPDSCFNPDSNGLEPPREAAISAVEAAWEKGIATRVISLDTVASAGAPFMQQLAVAGAGGLSTAQFYDATDTSHLRAAYEEIFQSLVSACEEQ